MFPVSGALQFNASGAIGLLPVISHNIAYSKLESPDTAGKNKFQRPKF